MAVHRLHVLGKTNLQSTCKQDPNSAVYPNILEIETRFSDSI